MLPDDVIAEQQRINRADALVLVYPIYWWSFPAQLKGWIDRVFTQGWAYDERDGKLVKLLGHLPVHLIALGGADQRTYARYGYFGSMKTQIDRYFRLLRCACRYQRTVAALRRRLSRCALPRRLP